jgi:hypothetical protein
MFAKFIFMNSLLHPVADDNPIVGYGRSHRYCEFTTRVGPPSTLRRVHLGSRSSGIGAWRPQIIVSTTVGSLASTRQQSYVVFLAVARRN